jgi:glyceraldehyde 3-phosphate dehydrogenase
MADTKLRVGINGLGKLGRSLVRIIAADPRVLIVAVNDKNKTIEETRRLIKDDHVRGKFDGAIEIAPSGKTLLVNGCCVTYFMESAPHHIPWGFVDVDLVIDTTHMFRTREELQGHIMAGAKRVVLAALPMDDPTIPTLAVGCNDDTYAGQDMIAAGTPKMQCFSPLIKIVNDAFGIDQAAMTVVHQIASEALVTGERCKGFCKGSKPARHFRAYGNHIFPIRSSSCGLIGNVIPEMKGKLCGTTLFVPSVTTSAADVVCCLHKGASPDKIVEAITAASETPRYKGLVKVSTEAVVSSDFLGESASCVFDGMMLTKAAKFTALSPTFVKLVAFADLTWSFGMRIVDLAVIAGASIKPTLTAKAKL